VIDKRHSIFRFNVDRKQQIRNKTTEAMERGPVIGKRIIIRELLDEAIPNPRRMHHNSCGNEHSYFTNQGNDNYEPQQFQTKFPELS